MQRVSFSDMQCSIAQTLEVVGEWWSLLIVRDALFDANVVGRQAALQSVSLWRDRSAAPRVKRLLRICSPQNQRRGLSPVTFHTPAGGALLLLLLLLFFAWPEQHHEMLGKPLLACWSNTRMQAGRPLSP